MPDINIPATTAMETLHPEGRILALQSGANVVMPNITSPECRRFYELYPDKAGSGDTPGDARSDIAAKIRTIGRRIGSDYGAHRPKKA